MAKTQIGWSPLAHNVCSVQSSLGWTAHSNCLPFVEDRLLDLWFIGT